MQTIKQPGNKEQLPNGLLDALEAADRVTVEIGTGNWPLFETQLQTGFNEHDVYVGINTDFIQHVALQTKVGVINGFALHNGPNQDSPLPDEIADTVYLANVMGEPYQEPGISPTDYAGSTDFDDKISTLDKAKGILKPTGKLVILETITPYKDEVSAGAPAMARLLEGKGYVVVDTVSKSDEEWPSRVATYDNPQNITNPNAYFIVAEKQ